MGFGEVLKSILFRVAGPPPPLQGSTSLFNLKVSVFEVGNSHKFKSFRLPFTKVHDYFLNQSLQSLYQKLSTLKRLADYKKSFFANWLFSQICTFV